jgi:hypothetical protein
MIKDVCFNDPGSPFLEEETSASAGYSAAISREAINLSMAYS